ncbi:MAG TPA: hypothetical protein DEP66_02930 [Acidimicrobiaceae bacterium]|nr:hypothetical protein [Acidimicrobiaceae bacterium]HCB37175.1 hypothetical protein [Acidimicrobiaceae bacterium]
MTPVPVDDSDCDDYPPGLTRWNDNPVYIGPHAPPEERERAAKLAEAYRHHWATGKVDKLQAIGQASPTAEDVPIEEMRARFKGVPRS